MVVLEHEHVAGLLGRSGWREGETGHQRVVVTLFEGGPGGIVDRDQDQAGEVCKEKVKPRNEGRQKGRVPFGREQKQVEASKQENGVHDGEREAEPS